MVKPISLRIHHAEVNARARRLLRRLDDEANLQRRIRWLSVKALISVREMRTVAAPKLASMSSSSRDRWQAEVQSIEKILLKISKQDIG
jgi:hypothetical protein